ncbi:hypothetical protein [Sulfurimonas sp.]|uniref:hypothetical protein n=1 Tax=Sulfurimonas sp. TaxID=2022749 RepID=UPI002B460F69|nr:hypothetical protein [Sulfurimonas sp.]
MITKEQWASIKTELSAIYSGVAFTLNDKKIDVHKVQISSTKLAWIVYIDGKINLDWGHSNKKNYDPLMEQLWHKKTRSLYKESEKKKIKKIWGVRRAKKEFPELEKKYSWYKPYFNSLSVLEKQFKKLDGLELIIKDENND